MHQTKIEVIDAKVRNERGFENPAPTATVA